MHVRLRIFPAAVLSLLFSPRLSIDGIVPTKMGWGTEFVLLAPGRHTATCGLGNYRRDSIDFVVPPSGSVSLAWRGPLLHGMAGTWKVLETAL